MLILLLSAVVPMLAVRAVQAVSIFNLQASVASTMRTQLTQEAQQDMLRTVDGYARSLDQEAALVFALVQVQAGQVQRRLLSPAPAEAPAIPTPREFEAWLASPPQGVTIQESPRHAAIDREGNVRPMHVSYDTQVVLLPRLNRLVQPRRDLSDDAEQAALREQVAQLADMTGIYAQTFKQANEFILWQYTTLESGLHFSYPAKAGFPPGYAPRLRPWYRLAINTDMPIATRPFVDVTTRQLIITFAQAVRDNAGNTLGVTAIDLPVSRMLDPAALNTDWADQAQVIVVAGQPASIDDPESDQINSPADITSAPDVYVVVDLNQDRRPVRGQLQIQTLKFDRPDERKAVTEDLMAGKNGVRRVSIDGQDKMIAYGRINPDAERPVFTMILAPTEVILAPSEQAIATIEDDLRESLVTTGLILLGLLLAVGLVAFGLSFRLTRPIMELVTASRRVAGGSLDAQVDFNRKDELGELGRAFNEMVPALRDRMKIRQSLQVAMQVQQSLLPAAPPHIPGLDIAGHSEYCDETGGDYYDFINLDELGPDTLAIAVGDVTGHGIAAALLMATGRALIRSHANTPNTLGQVFTDVNKQLCGGQFTGRFMTLMYLIVQSPRHCNPSTGCVSVRFLSAGHDPVIVYRPADDTFRDLAGHDIPLGIDPDWQFNEENAHDLRTGDILVVGTDGIWECFNPQGNQFGKDRLRDTIRQSAPGSAESIAQAISEACQHWRAEREQNDDITLVVVKLAG